MTQEHGMDEAAWEEAGPMVDSDGELHGYTPQGSRPSNTGKRSERNAAPASTTIASMTLLQIDQGRRPNPPTVCEICKASVWMASTLEVKCYCRILHRFSW